MTRILIIDDSRTSRKVLSNLLVENGYQVVGEAINGEEGLALYKELKPDLVTMDITMPVMDGLEALSEIMKFDENAKVIMVTAAGQESKVTRAIKAGAVEFLTKPYEKDTLLRVIKEVAQK